MRTYLGEKYGKKILEEDKKKILEVVKSDSSEDSDDDFADGDTTVSSGIMVSTPIKSINQ